MEVTGRKSPNRIRTRRKMHGVKQETLKKKLGLRCRSIISNWENGVSYPPVPLLFELAEIFNCQITDLYPELAKKAKAKHSYYEENERKKCIDDFD